MFWLNMGNNISYESIFAHVYPFLRTMIVVWLIKKIVLHVGSSTYLAEPSKQLYLICGK